MSQHGVARADGNRRDGSDRFTETDQTRIVTVKLASLKLADDKLIETRHGLLVAAAWPDAIVKPGTRCPTARDCAQCKTCWTRWPLRAERWAQHPCPPATAYTIELRRQYDAPIVDVWNAITTPRDRPLVEACDRESATQWIVRAGRW